MLQLSHLDASHNLTYTHAFKYLCAPVHVRIYCIYCSYSMCIHMNTVLMEHCVKIACKPINGAPSGEAFIRSNFQCYLPVLGANAQIEPFLSAR